MDPELAKARRFIQEKIFQFLAERQTQANEIPQRRILDLVKRLEEGLFRTAASLEEHLNLGTVEYRLLDFMRQQCSSNNPQHSQSTSAPLGTMIPTPGMSQHGNSNFISSSVDSSAVSAGSSAYLLPTENSSSAGMHGDGYAMDDVDTTGSRNFCSSTTSVGSMINNQNFNQGSAYLAVMDPEVVKARTFMHEKIYQFLAERHPESNEIPLRRIIDLAKRLEEGLFRTATSQEEYLNLDTLESRLHLFIKRPQSSSNNPQRSQLASAPLGPMIPTPGMSQHGHSNLIPSSNLRPPQSNDRSENLSLQSSQPSYESLLLPHHQHYQPQYNQLQQQPSFALNQSQQRQTSQQHQVLVTNYALHSSQLSSDGHHVKTEPGIEPLHEDLYRLHL